MKRNNQVAGMSSIFYEITKFMHDNFQHYDTISSHQYPNFQTGTGQPKTVGDFVIQCQRDSNTRLEQEKMGIDSGV